MIGWKPADFWKSTWYEFTAVLARHMPEPSTDFSRSRLDELMRLYPDQAKA
jgi:hypothetical protein